MSRLKILHLASADLWGGAEAQLDSLAGASQRLGLDVSAVLLNSGSELAIRLRRRGIEVLELDEARVAAPALLCRILVHVRRVHPDVIHTHRFKENILGGLVARVCRVGSIRTLHGAPESELMGATLRRRVLDFADAFAARHLQHHVVAVSHELAAKAGPHYPGTRISIVPNGVDIEGLRRESTGSISAATRVRLGFLGRLVPVKRVDLLLDAIDHLRRVTKVPFELVIVGDGPERAALEARTARLELGDLVHFIGFRADAATWIAGMDAVVLTSDHEGLPMVVLEALALGVPVVARAVGGIPEVLGEIDESCLIRSGAPEQISASLARLLERRRSPGERGSLLPKRYSADTMAAAYRSIYESVVRQ